MDSEDYDDSREQDPNAMDWSPTVSPAKQGPHVSLKRDNNGFILRPQKFYAPEEPTGLENLFEKTIRLADGDDQSNARSNATGKKTSSGGRRLPANGVVAVTAATCALIVAGVGVWSQRDRWR